MLNLIAASALKAIDFSVFQKSLFATGGESVIVMHQRQPQRDQTGEDGHISLWDSVSRKRQMNLCPHLAPVSAVAFSTVNKVLRFSIRLFDELISYRSICWLLRGLTGRSASPTW